MPRKDLKNKPLVEAILELKWALPTTQAPNIAVDPHYRLLLGRFYERVKDEYPFHEPLPTSTIPDEMVAHMVQHRFRIGEKAWPLLQLGPGILTVNETAGYTWADFQNRCEVAVSRLLDAYPAKEKLKVQAITLRYIDAVACDFKKESIFRFLRDKMKITVELPDNLFRDIQVEQSPTAFNWQASFSHRHPEGIVTLRFATGRRENESAIVWETLVVSEGSQAPALPDQISDWLSGAHEITDDWFFKLIEGELERRFSGE